MDNLVCGIFSATFWVNIFVFDLAYQLEALLGQSAVCMHTWIDILVKRVVHFSTTHHPKKSWQPVCGEIVAAFQLEKF